MTMEEPLLYRVVDACRVTGYSRSFIYEQITAGKLKVVRIGRTVRIAAVELRAWIERESEAQ